MFVMLGVMLPAFLLAMYERDGLPLETVIRNVLKTKFLRPGVRPYRTQNIYKQFAETEVQNIAKSPKVKSKTRRRKGR